MQIRGSCCRPCLLTLGARSTTNLRRLGQTLVVRGRFAPSPTGDLHLGNLRTALLSWMLSATEGGEFLIRMEDLDPVTSSPAHERGQLGDLAALGVVPLGGVGPVVRQSERFGLYEAAIDALDAVGLVYPCFCTRREIREAASAPHEAVPDGAYPGTCRGLTPGERADREAAGRRPALRLLTDGETYVVDDLLAGRYVGSVDDVVLRRNDGVPAYNLAVVVDDAAQGITQVVRGDDLLASTPRQMHLQHLLGLSTPEYVHVPLVLGADGQRLAKRHGAVTLADWHRSGHSTAELLALLGKSLGIDVVVTDALHATDPVAADLVAGLSLAAVPRHPWTLPDPSISATMGS